MRAQWNTRYNRGKLAQDAMTSKGEAWGHLIPPGERGQETLPRKDDP